jgi:hypothetical protein
MHCNYTYSAFASGSAGSRPDGGVGGNSSALPGAGAGGGAGSSFVANAIEYPTFTFPATSGDVFIEFYPVIEIDTPANGAVYSPGQVVDASWECAGYSSGPGGCNSSSGTVASGSPIDTTLGTHTFTVNGKVNVTGNGSQPVSATVTYTVASPPTASITTPASNATYAVGQVVNSRFSCSEGNSGPAIISCLDQNSNASGSPLGTSTPGTHTYEVIATSKFGLTGSATVSYTVAGPPSADISSPPGGQTYSVGQVVPTTFSCGEGPDAPGIISCTDSNGSVSPGQLHTAAAGQYTYTVTANSGDGQSGTATGSYIVAAAPSVSITAPASGATYNHGQAPSGRPCVGSSAAAPSVGRLVRNDANSSSAR